MLKNGTLLKVSPELIQALKNALDLRYLPLIQQARRQRRSLITDDVEAVDTGYNGMFKVIWDNEVDDEGNVTKYRVKIIDGDWPNDTSAGISDLGSIAVGHVTFSGLHPSWYVYVVGRYNAEEDKYEFYYTEVPEIVHGYSEMNTLLARVEDPKGQKKLIQVWKDEAIYWRERYWV